MIWNHTLFRTHK